MSERILNRVTREYFKINGELNKSIHVRVNELIFMMQLVQIVENQQFGYIDILCYTELKLVHEFRIPVKVYTSTHSLTLNTLSLSNNAKTVCMHKLYQYILTGNVMMNYNNKP